MPDGWRWPPSSRQPAPCCRGADAAVLADRRAVHAECNWSPCEPGRLIQIDGDRAEILASTSVGGSRTRVIGPRVTADGQTLIWSGSDGGTAQHSTLVSLFDLPTRQQTLVPTPRPTSDSCRYVCIPRRCAPSSSPDTASRSSWPSPVARGALPQPKDISWLGDLNGDGNRLSFQFASGLGVRVVDSRDGRLVGTLRRRTTPIFSTTTAPDSSRCTGLGGRVLSL